MNNSLTRNQLQLAHSLIAQQATAAVALVSTEFATPVETLGATIELTQPLHPPEFAPALMSRQELFARSPMLTKMLEVALNDCHADGGRSDVLGVLAPFGAMAELLPEHKYDANSVFVLFLPDNFEPFLLDAVSQMPGLDNHLSTDLLYSCFCMEWAFGPGHEIWVPTSFLYSHIFCNFKYSDNALNGGNHVFVPIILVAGNAAAVGGFIANDELMGDAHAQSCTAVNHSPYYHFGSKELAEAALEAESIGNHPWLKDSHEIEPGLHVISLLAQNFNELLSANDARRIQMERMNPQYSDI